MKDPQKYLEGQLLLINKPYDWSSFDAVKKIKGILFSSFRSMGFEAPGNKLKVGHAGTLDPYATGLLIVCTGKATKKIQEVQDAEKEYTGTLQLGATTPSFDLEREVDKEFPVEHITEEMICNAALKFTGSIMQVPPAFSAIKIDGKRAYKSARRGKEMDIKAKEIYIAAFEITGINMPFVHFRVVCSKGTYIRSLARDFGESLGSGAHLTALERTRIGAYKLQDAMSIQEFEQSVL